MKKSTLRATAALQALALLGAGAGAAFIAAPAAAQDYTSGVITGTVTDESGNAVSGATVTLTSKSQGFTRTATSGGNGTFRFNGLASGDYNVSVEAANNAGFQATDVKVLAGQTADLNIQLSSTEEIVVTGAQIQAFEGTTTGLNVDVEELKKTVPVGRNLTSVVLLAPGTSRGDSAFGNLASVGGSSVAENAYYINGLNITNFDNYLGSAEVPFDFYKSVEVKSGGYPAEYGRATGGIVNAVTKAGSNDFKAALHLNWAPNFLQAHGRDLQNCSDDPDTGARTCSPLTYRHYEYSKSLSATAEVGGPIFRDRLFAYGLLQMQNREYSTINLASGKQFAYRNNDPFWGVKVDAFPIDDHHLEFTIFSTRNTLERGDGDFTLDASGVPTAAPAASVTAFEDGGTNYVGKYTGRFTDWLTLSAAYGRMRDRADFQGVAGAGSLPFVRNDSPNTVNGVDPGGLFTAQTVNSTTVPYALERRFYRGDADVYATLLGDHHFRAGFDVEKNNLARTTISNGGAFLTANGYETNNAYTQGGGTGLLYLLAPNGAAGQTRVDVQFYKSGGTFDAKNTAYYLQDEWKPTDRLTLNLGVRRDDFKVFSGDGSPLVTLSKNYAPRIGATYDLFSDRRGKIKAFYGWYYLPFASNTAYRNTGSEFYFTQRFNYSGFDSNGVPILTSPDTTDPTYVTDCPFEIVPGQGTDACVVTSDGTPANAESYIAKNLKATKEAEWIVGYEHKLGRWKLGVDYTHRNLLRTAEDVAIDAAVNKYCTAGGFTCTRPNGSLIYNGFRQYVIMNPGSDLQVLIHGCRAGGGAPAGTVTCTELEGQVITLKAEDLGYPKAKRTYDALSFTFDRPYDGVWSLGGSYTWSKSKGNTEGYVQSDFGQRDAGITQDFDQPGFTDYSYGYLPNDRRHRLKLYGAYTFDDKFTIGSNFTLESPRSLSCFGYHPTDVFANAYGAASHYCQGKPSPRGTAQKTDWTPTLDLKASYKMSIPTGQTLTLRTDVFNVLNSKAVQSRYEFGDLDAAPSYTPDPNYGQITGYQAPRTVRLGMDIEF